MAQQGFALKRNLEGVHESPVILQFIIKNSAVFRKNDAVTIDQNGFARRAVAGEVVGGVCDGVCDVNGLRIDPDSTTLDTYTVASDNQTVAKKKCRLIPALPNYLFKATVESALTQNTDLLAFTDLIDHDTVDASISHTSSAQCKIVAIDPDNESDLTQVLVQFVESQFAQVSANQPA